MSILKKACAISPTVRSSITLSVSWSAASRVAKNWGIISETELKELLEVCSVASLDTTSDIVMSGAECMARFSTPPKKTVMNAGQLARLRLRGKTDEAIKEEREFAHAKKMARYNEEMAHYKKHSVAICAALDKAFATKIAIGKQWSSYQTSIITSRIELKLAERDAMLTDYINDGLKHFEKEQDDLWRFQIELAA